jgi:hypothetical protein
MLNQATEQLILPATARLGAPIHSLLVDRAPDVIVQRAQRLELSRAEIALVEIAVPRALRGDHVDAVAAARQGQERARDDVVAVEAADHVVDLGAVEAGCCAAPGFEVDGHARGGREAAFAEGALDGAAHVGSGVHVLGISGQLRRRVWEWTMLTWLRLFWFRNIRLQETQYG